ncbi:hypothetical protein HDK77DRAFT_483339 [Phyllosticta capitalensis]|uniref:uncharacterized protein n=1 Tax=Phyllosticta capitalensis TaxID=121624 RepID=UPI00312CE8BF
MDPSDPGADKMSSDARILSLEPRNSRGGPDFRLWFASFQEPGEGICKLDLPEVEKEFLELSQKDSNGFSGSRTVFHVLNHVEHDTWWCFKIKVAEHDPNGGKSRISSRWLQPSFYIAWSTIDDITLILGIDVPSAVQEIVKNAFNNGSIGQDDPYGWHEFLIRTISELYDFSFWKMRDLVREQVEKNRSTDATKFEMLHEVARHVILSNETLDVAMRTISAVQRIHQGFSRLMFDTCSRSKNPKFRQRQSDIELGLSGLEDLLYAKLARCGALRDRIGNEINLAFSLCSQSEVFMTKTIAVITLVFLPGSLVAAIFGMNLLDFSSADGLIVSDKFWIFVVLTIGLTVVTFGTWLALLRTTKKLTPLSEEIRSTKDRHLERQSTLLQRLNRSKSGILASRV